MESTDAEIPQHTQHQELLELAGVAAKELVNCDEVTARVIIDDLNVKAVRDRLVSSDVVLNAAFIVRTHSQMNLKTGGFERVSLPDDSENVLVGGIFVGFEAIRY